MRNVTIVVDDETARWVRIEAARHDTSVSRWIGQLLDERRQHANVYEQAQRSYLSRSAAQLKVASRSYPSRDDIHER